MPGIRFDFAAPAALVFLIIITGILAAVWYYQRTIPVVSGHLRALLTALRAASLSLLLLLFTQPLLHLSFTSVEPPSLAVIVDNSASMNITEQGKRRGDAVHTALRDNVFKAIGRRANVHYYKFGLRLTTLQAPEADTLTFNDEATDLSAAIQALGREKELHRIDAGILITDGTLTLGRNPIYDADAVGVPLYTVGIGDTSESRDLVITKVVANQIVYSDVPTPVDVTLKSSGFGRERIQVGLFRGTNEIARSALVLQPGTREYSIPLTYVPEGEGSTRYTVKADVLPGELTAKNNRSTFIARVLKSKLRLLLLAGEPSPDVAILGQVLREEKNFDVRSFTQRLSGGYYEGTLTKNLLDSMDCFIFIGFPTPATPGSSLQLIVDALTSRNLPLLFIAGLRVDYNKLRQLGTLIPFSAEVFAPAEQYVTALPIETERLHPLVSLDSPDGADVWKRLPPLFRTLTFYKARPESRILIGGKTENMSTVDPLVIIRSVGRERSMAITAYSLWRWRLLVQGDSQTEGFLAAFLSETVRWLTSPDNSRPVRVEPTKELFVQGEPAEFIGQVYTAASAPIDNARITLSVQRQSDTFSTELRAIGNGRYEGRFEGLVEGEYSYKAVAEADGVTIGSDEGKFSVGGISLEFQDTRPNFSLLRLLALRTGGQFFYPSELRVLDSALATQPHFITEQVQRTKEYELWNWQYILGAIVLLLAIEWVVRRKTGML